MRFTRSRCLTVAVAVLAATPIRAQDTTRMMGAPFHDPSRAFIDLMIPHHEMSLMMAEHAVRGVRSDSVKALARRMAAEQTREIAELRDARRALFGSDSARSPMMRAMMEMMGMHGMRDTTPSRAMMDSMRVRGDTAGRGGQRPAMMSTMPGDHDRMFLQHLIVHHEEGIDMAVLAEDSQATPRVKELARRIRRNQEREIAEMRRLLATLPGAPAAGHKH